MKYLYVLIIILSNWTLYAEEPLRVGWISPLTGGAARYGADLSLELALYHINSAGGINGRKLEVIVEDGQCNQVSALKAAKKLVELDQVDAILGGHCSPESATIAPYMERSKKLMIASISSTPALSRFSRYVFRTSPNAIHYAPTIAAEAIKDRHKRFVVLYEDTDYTSYPANHLNELLQQVGIETEIFSFEPGTIELRSLIARIKAVNPGGIYIATQVQDTAAVIFKLLNQYKVNAALYGNEVTASAHNFFPELKKQFEGLKYAEVAYDSTNAKTKRFISEFTKFHKTPPPYGFWNADAYDGIMILASVLKECPGAVDNWAECLKQVQNYPGASGQISFDSKGDAVRQYVLKKIEAGAGRRVN